MDDCDSGKIALVALLTPLRYMLEKKNEMVYDFLLNKMLIHRTPIHTRNVIIFDLVYLYFIFYFLYHVCAVLYLYPNLFLYNSVLEEVAIIRQYEQKSPRVGVRKCFRSTK